MLLLTRRPSETIIINGNIKITVCSVKGNSVKIGIDAPPEVTVNREEVHDRIQQGIHHPRAKPAVN